MVLVANLIIDRQHACPPSTFDVCVHLSSLPLNPWFSKTLLLCSLTQFLKKMRKNYFLIKNNIHESSLTPCDSVHFKILELMFTNISAERTHSNAAKYARQGIFILYLAFFLSVSALLEF